MTTSGWCSSRVSAEPGIIASRPGQGARSVRSLTTASRNSSASAKGDSPRALPARKFSIDSQRSSRPEASVVPRAGQATRTKRVTRISAGGEFAEQFGERDAVGVVGGVALLQFVGRQR